MNQPGGGQGTVARRRAVHEGGTARPWEREGNSDRPRRRMTPAGVDKGRHGGRQGGVASEPPRGDRRRKRALQLSSVQKKL